MTDTHDPLGLTSDAPSTERRALIIPAVLVEALAIDGGTITISVTKAAPPATADAIQALSSSLQRQSEQTLAQLEELADRVDRQTLDVDAARSQSEEARRLLETCGHTGSTGYVCSMTRADGVMGRCSTAECPHKHAPTKEGTP